MWKLQRIKFFGSCLFIWRSKGGKKKLLPWLFLTPSLVGVIVFTGIPFLDVIKRSFQDAMGTRFMGLRNYQAVLENSAFRLAAGNTVRFLAVCMPLLLLLSLGMALLISSSAEQNRLRDQGMGIFRTTLVLPMTIPAASMVLVWKIILCPEGTLNQLLAGVTGTVWETDWAFSQWAFPVLIITYLWKHAGYDMILWLAGLWGISGELYEAAKIDGAGAWARMWYITLPGLTGTFGLVGVLSIVNSFRVYREAYLLAGSYPEPSIYLIPHLFAHWFLSLDVQKMTAAAVMMVGAAVLPMAVALVIRRRSDGQ